MTNLQIYVLDVVPVASPSSAHPLVYVFLTAFSFSTQHNISHKYIYTENNHIFDKLKNIANLTDLHILPFFSHRLSSSRVVAF